MEEDIKILENLIKYLQLKIDSGEHKIFYNNDMYDEKTIDCINSLEHLLQAYKEDEAVIEEMAKDIIILDEIGQSKCCGCRNKRKEQKCIECRITDFRNKVKGEKE